MVLLLLACNDPKPVPVPVPVPVPDSGSPSPSPACAGSYILSLQYAPGACPTDDLGDELTFRLSPGTSTDWNVFPDGPWVMSSLTVQPTCAMSFRALRKSSIVTVDLDPRGSGKGRLDVGGCSRDVTITGSRN